MAQAGVILSNWDAIADELQRDWRLKTGFALARLLKEHLKFYGMLMDNFQRATALAQGAKG